MADIDVEDENILTTIFKDSFPESWQDNPDFIQYLVELSSYGADRLTREPERLAEEKAQILAETQDLAFHNYTTFIQTADCSKEIFQDFQIIEQNLENLLRKLPAFSDECNKVITKAQEISSSRRMNTLTLQRHTQLLEVLEIPQLMDTCVRNAYYEEALELAAHVKRLEKKHPNIPVIASIVKEVKGSTQLMLNQLIQQLRTNLQLPACLKVIGFLRRMDIFNEAELRIKFLQARDSWFQSILEAIPKGDAYTHITKTIEASRVHLFDIMTQFRAIFSDEDPLVSTGKEEGVNETLLFHSWVLQKVSQFLTTLTHDLEQGVGGRLDSILGQCMYFGLSFSRVGADFRGLLAPIFERAALQYFKAATKEANKKFEENMQSYNLLGLPTTGGLPLGAAVSQSGHLYPPTNLLDFYPLAAYCNHILSAFNDLRLCSPLTLASDVAEELQRSLMEVNRVILAFHRAEEPTFNPKERDQFEQFCATYATDLLPYLNKCLQVLYPPTQLANALGISVSELNKKVSVGQMSLSEILSKVDHLMPSSPQISSAATDATSGEEEEGEGSKPVKFTIDSSADSSKATSPITVESDDGSKAATDGTGKAVVQSAAQQQQVGAGDGLGAKLDQSKSDSSISQTMEQPGSNSVTEISSNPQEQNPPEVEAGSDHPPLIPELNMSESTTALQAGGAWSMDDLDLDSVDPAITPTGSVIDLDNLPTPLGSQADLELSVKQDLDNLEDMKRD